MGFMRKMKHSIGKIGGKIVHASKIGGKFVHDLDKATKTVQNLIGHIPPELYLTMGAV